MKKEMLINVLQPEECRIAIIEDGVLEELYVERTSHESYTGNIYKGRIVNLEPAIQAAFVDFSVGRNGFLHVSDVEPQYFDRDQRRHDEPEPAPRIGTASGSVSRVAAGAATIAASRPRPEPLEPPPGGMPPAPPRLEERPRERGRDRDKDRGRERERPDLSIRGRRDRSEPPPRRFGEGLVEPPECRLEPVRPAEPAPSQPQSAVRGSPLSSACPKPRALLRQLARNCRAASGTRTSTWSTEHGARIRPERRSRPSSASLRRPSRRAVRARVRPIEPFDPDLPPSRTQRLRGPAAPTRPGETEGQERGRHRVPPHLLRRWTNGHETGHGHGEPEIELPARPRAEKGAGRGRGGRHPRRAGRDLRRRPRGKDHSIPEIEPGTGPDDLGPEPDFENVSRQ